MLLYGGVGAAKGIGYHLLSFSHIQQKGGESKTMSTNSSSNFDDMIQDQVEQFNQRLQTSANFHRHVLEMLCAERTRRGCEALDGPLLRPKVEPSVISIARRFQPGSRVGNLGKLRQAGKQPILRVLSTEPSSDPVSTRSGRSAAGSEEMSVIIEGEYRVINNATDVPNTAETT